MDCPTCGKPLNTEQGMRQHHTKVHDDQRPNRTCKACDERFYDPKSRRTYCKDCYTGSGTQNGNWKDAKERTECERCGNEFEYYPSDKDGVYCSACVESADEFLGTPSYANKDIPRVDTQCEHCGETFTVLETRFKETPCRFCSHECLCDWMSELMYEGDRPPNVYNGDWLSVRDGALDRDNHECQICGKTQEDIGNEPDVHHIDPIRTFDDPQDAHTLDNVITLCRKCHRNVETDNLNCPDPNIPAESRKG